MRKQQQDQFTLTDAEKDALRAASRRHSVEVKDFIKEQGGLDGIGSLTSAHMKIAAAARAEREAIMAVRERQAVLGDSANAEDYRRRLVDAESRAKVSALEAGDAKRELQRVLVRESMAVNSDD